jgi:hypothetical protein
MHKELWQINTSARCHQSHRRTSPREGVPGGVHLRPLTTIFKFQLSTIATVEFAGRGLLTCTLGHFQQRASMLRVPLVVAVVVAAGTSSARMSPRLVFNNDLTNIESCE